MAKLYDNAKHENHARLMKTALMEREMSNTLIAKEPLFKKLIFWLIKKKKVKINSNHPASQGTELTVLGELED